MDHGTLVTILVVGRVAEFDVGIYFFDCLDLFHAWNNGQIS